MPFGALSQSGNPNSIFFRFADARKMYPGLGHFSTRDLGRICEIQTTQPWVVFFLDRPGKLTRGKTTQKFLV